MSYTNENECKINEADLSSTRDFGTVYHCEGFSMECVPKADLAGALSGLLDKAHASKLRASASS